MKKRKKIIVITVLIIAIVIISTFYYERYIKVINAKAGDVALYIELNSHERILNQTEIIIEVTYKNKINNRVLLGRPMYDIEVKDLDNNLYSHERSVSTSGTSFILVPKERFTLESIIDSDFVGFLTGNYSVQGYYDGDIDLRSNIEYFQVIK